MNTKLTLALKDINHTVFVTLLSLISLIKLYGIRYSEIISDPYDPLNYINRAYNGVWFSDKIGIGNLGHPPGYSLFIWLTSFSGIPLRLCHEFLYIFSVGLLVFALRHLKFPRFVCVLFFSILIFYPLTFRFFNDARSEALTISLYLILIAVTIFLITQKRGLIFWSCLSGLILGLMVIARPEKPLILAYLLGMLVIACLNKQLSCSHKRFKIIVSFCLIPLIIMNIISFSVSTLNYISFGVPGVSLLDSASFKGVYTKLMKIDIGTNQRYVPISQAQLRAAYEVSPNLKKLKLFLDSNDEMKGGHTGWILMYAARQSASDTTPRNIYKIYTNINQELKIAFEQKKLPSKTFAISILDPNFDVWMPHLKDSITKVLRRFIFPPKLNPENIFFVVKPETIPSLFDQMANRRAALLGYNNPNSKLLYVLNLFTKVIPIINILGLISFVFLLGYYFVIKSHSLLFDNYISLLFIILLVESSRLLLYSLVDATSWEIPLRYLFPGMPLFSGLSLLNLFLVINLIIKKKLRSF